MNAGAWREQAVNAVREADAGDARMLDRLALLLEQQDAAVQRLRELGYGWTGLGLLEAVALVPGAPAVEAAAAGQGEVMGEPVGAGGGLLPCLAAVIPRGELRRGDLLVLSCPGMMTDRTYTRLVRQMGEEVGEGVKVILLEDGITVNAILGRPGSDTADDGRAAAAGA